MYLKISFRVKQHSEIYFAMKCRNLKTQVRVSVYLRAIRYILIFNFYYDMFPAAVAVKSCLAYYSSIGFEF